MHVVRVINDSLDEVLKCGSEQDLRLVLGGCLGRSLGGLLGLDRGLVGLGLQDGLLLLVGDEGNLGFLDLDGALGVLVTLEDAPVAGELEDRLDLGLGCAPTLSQYCARSDLTSMNEGSSVGWYLPISSMTRPSRLVRESATTMR